MITQLSLSDAVSKLYGKSLIPCGSPMSEWQLFSPYSIPASESKLLLRMLEVPAHVWTSEQICNKTIEKYKGLLHQVKLIFVERCFQSSYYLLAAKENLIPLSSLVKIKKQSGEKVDETLIYDYLQFTNKLQKCPYANQLQFDEYSLGINQQGNFVLANYLLYFEEQNFLNQKDKQRNSSRFQCPKLMRDIRKMLVKLLMVGQQKVDLMELYSSVQIHYGKDMVKIVQKIMEPECDVTEVTAIIDLLRISKADQSLSATITDTGIEDCQKISQNFMNQSYNTLGFDQSIKKFKKYQKSLKRKKITGFIIIFVIILFGIAAITFKYLTPRPLRCEQNQYPDQQGVSCLNCDTSCDRCSGAGSLMCTSCKGNLYLLMKTIADKTGRCSEDCHGTIVRTKICIDNH